MRQFLKAFRPIVRHFAALIVDWAARFQPVAFLGLRLASVAE